MTMHVSDEGLLIPRELTERLGSDEVEIIEEPGRLVIVAGPPPTERTEGVEDGDPILRLGLNPVRTDVRDGSTRHDAYLYDKDA